MHGSFRREKAGGFLFDTREDFYYVANGLPPEAGAVDVRFRFRLLTTPPEFRDGGTARVLIAAQRPSLHHFSVTLTPDTIAFTETSRIFVQAKDADSQAVEFDTTALLRLSLTAKEEYGTFIDKNGDTLTRTPVRLENVPYGDVKSGVIRFAAVNKNPDSLVVCRMQVELQSDSSKNAEKDIIVLEKTLKIVMADPHAVRPSIPTENGNAALVDQRKKPFEVSMTRGRRPVANHPFRLRTDYVRGSGGHDHDDTPAVVRTDNDDNYGYFTAGQSTTRRRPLVDSTNALGRFAVTYHASIFGDTMKVYLDSRANRLLKDSISVTELVAGLELLPDNANYASVGGTCNHHGPSDRGIGNQCQTPNNNHGINSEALGSLESAASEFRNARWNRSRERMRINDISLPFGGLFDISGRWLNPHDSHRNGKDVDIENINRLRQLRRVLEPTWEYIPEGPTFYPHFRFGH